MARCTRPDWKAQLPWILLGMRKSPKKGLHVSPAEVVFGEALVVPGKFFPSPNTTVDDNNLARLRHTVGKYRPCFQTHKTSLSRYFPISLNASKYIFVRYNAYKPPLTSPYRGPYAVLECNSKAFRLSIAGGIDWVSIDCLKPAYLEEEDSKPTSPLVDDPTSTSHHLGARPPAPSPKNGPRPTSSRTGRLI
ncbi:uncharacterized protein LOC135101778 [Scylla paramamosain]|uniref:uncharacterized protein LOC135101778 n=1 Tax=Scylla paramamosain TaxID=85552 RepID=UPI003083396A